jgi:bifunctional non-homologous end joining protein LigD
LILVPSFFGTEAKTREFDKIKAQQKEGVVFKKISAVFSEGRPETGGDMVKCKFWATLSAIVDEKATGKSSFISYVLDPQGKRVYLGHCSALGKVMPQAGAVVELRYLYAYKGGKLIQQVFLGIRDDVNPEECTTRQLKFKSEQ